MKMREITRIVTIPMSDIFPPPQMIEPPDERTQLPGGTFYRSGGQYKWFPFEFTLEARGDLGEVVMVTCWPQRHLSLEQLRFADDSSTRGRGTKILGAGVQGKVFYPKIEIPAHSFEGALAEDVNSVIGDCLPQTVQSALSLWFRVEFLEACMWRVSIAGKVV